MTQSLLGCLLEECCAVAWTLLAVSPCIVAKLYLSWWALQENTSDSINDGNTNVFVHCTCTQLSPSPLPFLLPPSLVCLCSRQILKANSGGLWMACYTDWVYFCGGRWGLQLAHFLSVDILFLSRVSLSSINSINSRSSWASRSFWVVVLSSSVITGYMYRMYEHTIVHTYSLYQQTATTERLCCTYMYMQPLHSLKSNLVSPSGVAIHDW